MEFFAAFFTSFFANGLLVSAHGINGYRSLASQKGKAKYACFAFYLFASVILGLIAYGLAYVMKALPALAYFEVLILVSVMILLTLAFLGISRLFKDVSETLRKALPEILLNTALYSIAIAVLTLFRAETLTWPLLFANILGLPLGFLVSVLVVEPIERRLEISAAPKAFKGVPLVLICLAALSLAVYGLAF
jgi:Na+-translocating ferredoxin:NAD+ oxidoreductase RnfA subunit